MRTVVEPKQHIAALWSKPEVRNGETFRMMRYILRVDHEGKVLLHNMVTGQLVVLDHDEAELVEKLPMRYSSQMQSLIDAHFLVVSRFDEHQQVFGMRTVLRKLDAIQAHPAITSYTILPTTACNARCYYCFEHGVETVTMSEQTAEDVVDFISQHCGSDKKVFISWFGGEPTVAVNRIDQICRGLRNNGIDFWSDMTTNGYLFDSELVDRAATLWNLKSVMISVDGTESNYNRVKAFVGVKGSPYQRIIRNIGLLLQKCIHVDLRMNFDLGNYNDFPELLEEVSHRFRGSAYLHVRAHPVNGEYPGADGVIVHGDDDWFDKKVVELNNLSRDCGLLSKTKRLPWLRYEGCEANNDSSVTITPSGMLVRCPEQFGSDQFTGNIIEGITHPERVESWKQFVEFRKCEGCVLYPRCNRLVNCSAKDRCTYFSEQCLLFEESIRQCYSEWKDRENVSNNILGR